MDGLSLEWFIGWYLGRAFTARNLVTFTAAYENYRGLVSCWQRGVWS